MLIAGRFPPEGPGGEKDALELLIREHRERSGASPEVIAFAPGRVNLIGEHVDYHGGLCLPAAISLGTYVSASRRTSDARRRLRSLSEAIEVELEGRGPTPESLTLPRWALYPLGTIDMIESALGDFEGGFDLTFVSTLPKGLGLSSSAALEIATGLALSELFERPVDPKKLALIVQQAETKASGVRVGPMDPLAIALGRARSALLIDCTELSVTPVPLPLDEFAVVVCDSGRSRALAAGAYNTRREESQQALEALELATGIAFVGRAVTHEILEAAAGRLSEPRHRRRLAHIVTENERTRKCVAALQARDMVQVRDLFQQSHRSLRYDYEVSTPELDGLVELARDVHPLVAARLTGAGFGGATVNLVPRQALRYFLREVPARFAERFSDAGGGAAMEVEIAEGARRIA